VSRSRQRERWAVAPPLLFFFVKSMRSDWCFTCASMIDPLPLPSHVPILALITRLTSLALYCTHTTLVAKSQVFLNGCCCTIRLLLRAQVVLFTCARGWAMG